jgi:pimeloyl-ACP methyl ester carboxylesterase
VTANEALEADHLRDAAALARVDVPEVVTPAHHDLVVRGMRLHYLDWGTSGMPPLLFLHGGALTARTWDLVCLGMRSEFHCLAVDQRGHGDSEWSPSLDYSLEAHVGDVEGLIDALALTDPVLIGHSLGAFVGIELAARNPDALRALVLVDAAPGVSQDATKIVSDFILGPGEFDSVEECVVLARRFNPRRNERLLRRSLLHNLRELPDGRRTWKYDRRHLSPEAIEEMRQRFNLLSDRLADIECPTLIVRGGDSEALSEADVARVVDQIPRATSVQIDGAGHTVQGDNPRDLTDALRTFLRAVLNGG